MSAAGPVDMVSKYQSAHFPGLACKNHVEIGKDGYTMDDVLVHDAHTTSNFLHQQLAMMDGHSLPIALGRVFTRPNSL